MFTGIITDIGATERAGDLIAQIGCSYDVAKIDIGASIACDGCCLTVTELGQTGDQGWFKVSISAESLSKTTLDGWSEGTKINLERALKVGDELGGHIVSGHVDGLAEIISVTAEGDSTRYQFRVPDDLARFIAPKGSVALDGTSLTVNEVQGSIFGVNIIPHTQEVTTWGLAKTGDKLNLEIDTMARYVARLAEYAP